MTTTLMKVIRALIRMILKVHPLTRMYRVGKRPKKRCRKKSNIGYNKRSTKLRKQLIQLA